MKIQMKFVGLNNNILNSKEHLVGNENKVFIRIDFSYTMLNDSNDSRSYSTVRFAAATNKTPYKFVGDFFYINCQIEEEISFYNKIITSVFNNFFKNDIKPSEIIFYRTSVLKEKYDEYKTQNVLYIKRILQKKPKLCLLKNQFDFMDSNKNIVFRTVMNKEYIKKGFRGICLNSNFLIIDSTKMPVYVAVYNKKSYSMDEIRNFTKVIPKERYFDNIKKNNLLKFFVNSVKLDKTDFICNILMIPRIGETYYLFCDSSGLAHAAYLAQKDKNEIMRAVTYFSKRKNSSTPKIHEAIKWTYD
uniref:Piwi domain-containing protein n=1 Tax=Strongyloides stercoralis TaxID=6248 RepID=A0AAF5I2U9_STRER